MLKIPGDEPGRSVPELTKLPVSVPDAVIVLYGANDSLRGRSARVFISDVEFIVNEALDLGVEPILVQVTEVCCGRADLVMFPGGLQAWKDVIFEYKEDLEDLG